MGTEKGNQVTPQEDQQEEVNIVNHKPISHNIFVAEEDGLPVIVGECPTCRRGFRSLVLVDFVPKAKTAASSVYLRCVCCNSIHHKQIKDITED